MKNCKTCHPATLRKAGILQKTYDLENLQLAKFLKINSSTRSMLTKEIGTPSFNI